ncbi:MAG: glycoside hydrolase [Flavobacteriales bacterium]|nr:glycoside hydrolase [Flavobacteriales bacterium]
MRILLLIVIGSLLWSCAATQSTGDHRIDGIALEGPPHPAEDAVMQEIAQQGAEWVCLMPYAYMKDTRSELIYGPVDWTWWGEKSDGIRALIHRARAADLSIMLKPHLWIGRGYYTGELSFSDTAQQEKWNADYRQYLLHYAHMAEEEEVELLCIGTELCMQLNDDPAFWTSLIEDIREVYTGKLTYAANWDCYQDFPLWKQLDYIGIDAYFPITEVEEPKMEDALAGWTYWKESMRKYVDTVGRPILFTEYGYRSKKGALAEPWVSGTGADGEPDKDIQSLGYEALYCTFWNEAWFQGGFLWKWHVEEMHRPAERSKDYTPQEKPAMDIIRKHYGAQSLKKKEQ